MLRRSLSVIPRWNPRRWFSRSIQFYGWSFFSRCLRPRCDTVHRPWWCWYNRWIEGDLAIRKHAPIRLKSSVARNYCPKLYVSRAGYVDSERFILPQVSYVTPATVLYVTRSCVTALSLCVESPSNLTRSSTWLDTEASWKRFVENWSVLLPLRDACCLSAARVCR